MDTKRIVTAVRRLWWLPIASVILGLLIGVLATQVQTKKYTSTVRLFVSSTGGTTSTEAYQGDQFSQQRTSSYTHIITSEKLAQKVIDELGLPMSASELSSNITATIVPRTVLLDVAVTDTSPQRAADIAKTLADQFIVFAASLETPVGQKEPRSTITIVNDAQPPSSPSSPKIATNAFYGVLGGAVLGVLAIALTSALSQRVRTTDELARIVGAPVLGPVVVPQREANERSAQLASWTGPEAEGFRRLRVQLESREPIPTTYLVASPTSSQTAMRFSIDMAIAFAEAGRNTALVVAAREFQSMLSDLGVDTDRQGLADLLTGQATSLNSVASQSHRENLFAIPPGRTADMESLLTSPAMNDVLDDLSKRFDRVVVLVPGVNQSSAPAVLSAITDAELLVVDANSDTRVRISQAVKEFNASRVQLLGAVLAHS